MIMNEAFKGKLTDIPCPCASPPLKKTKQQKKHHQPCKDGSCFPNELPVLQYSGI